MLRKGLNLARRPMTAETEDGDLEEMGLEYGGEYGGEEGGEGMEEPPEGDDPMSGFQEAVTADRAKRGRYMESDEFDKWDMEWRERGKRAGLDPQEVDAFMDSLWEGEEDPSWEADDRAAGYGR